MNLKRKTVSPHAVDEALITAQTALENLMLNVQRHGTLGQTVQPYSELRDAWRTIKQMRAER